MNLEAIGGRESSSSRDARATSNSRPRATNHLAAAHALFLIAFGAWPNVHMRSFEAVTGKKKEPWLVRAVGLLLITSGSAIAVAERQGRLTPSTRLLATGVSASLGTISLTYATKGRISPIYFVDAALHAGFAAAWLLTTGRRR